jgi:hypothetical protein
MDPQPNTLGLQNSVNGVNTSNGGHVNAGNSNGNHKGMTGTNSNNNHFSNRHASQSS